MLITDPISDMFIRIKNALLSEKETVAIPHSKMKEAIILKLKENNYILDYEVIEEKPQNQIIVKLKYVDGIPVISGLKRISSPGRRLYSSSKNIPRTLNSYGITLVSTSKGVLTDKEARKNNVGGELIFQIW
jgi:small subunit ribosomal protein S8